MGGMGPTAGTLRSRVEPGAFGSSVAPPTQGFPGTRGHAPHREFRWHFGDVPRGNFSGGSRADREGPRAHAHLEMEVRTGRVPGAAHARDRLPAEHPIALDDQVLGVVRVHGDQAVRVPDEHQVAVAAPLAREQHLALPGREHRRAFGAGQIDAVVVLAVALAEAGDEHAADGPGERLAARGGVQRVPARPWDLRRRRPGSAARLHARLRRVGRGHRALAIRAGDEQPGAGLELRRVGEPVGALQVRDRDGVRPRDAPQRLARLHEVADAAGFAPGGLLRRPGVARRPRFTGDQRQPALRHRRQPSGVDARGRRSQREERHQPGAGARSAHDDRPGRSHSFSSSSSACSVRSRCSGVTEMSPRSNTASQSLPGTFSCACSSPPIQ